MLLDFNLTNQTFGTMIQGYYIIFLILLSMSGLIN